MGEGCGAPPCVCGRECRRRWAGRGLLEITPRPDSSRRMLPSTNANTYSSTSGSRQPAEFSFVAGREFDVIHRVVGVGIFGRELPSCQPQETKFKGCIFAPSSQQPARAGLDLDLPGLFFTQRWTARQRRCSTAGDVVVHWQRVGRGAVQLVACAHTHTLPACVDMPACACADV